MSKSLIRVAVLGLALGMAPSLMAVVISHVDLATVTLGPVNAPALTTSILPIFPPPPSMGSVEGTVYFDGTVYTYVLDVTPAVPNFSEFNTGFDVQGFNGVAGWSHTDAFMAGAILPGLAFSINHDVSDNTLDFEAVFQDVAGSSGWDTGESIRLFFQSTLPPTSGPYGAINGEVGGTMNHAPGALPVPEPATILMAGMGLVALGALRRRKSA